MHIHSHIVLTKARECLLPPDDRAPAIELPNLEYPRSIIGIQDGSDITVCQPMKSADMHNIFVYDKLTLGM
jgi:hypothetical protein